MGLAYVDGGKDCTDNVTNFDYDRVRLGFSVSRSSRSPWCEKVSLFLNLAKDNPLSLMKVVFALYRRVRDLAELQHSGKIRF